MPEGGEATQAGAKELRIFGLVLGALFAACFGVWPLLRHRASPAWPWMLAGSSMAVCFDLARCAQLPSSRLDSILGLALGWVNTRIILTLLFAITIVPVGLMMRLFGRDRMARKLDPALSELPGAVAAAAG